MSEHEHAEFMNSLELARRALYARDPKRRTIETVERLARETEVRSTEAKATEASGN